jgi:hypothetical protein
VWTLSSFTSPEVSELHVGSVSFQQTSPLGKAGEGCKVWVLLYSGIYGTRSPGRPAGARGSGPAPSPLSCRRTRMRRNKREAWTACDGRRGLGGVTSGWMARGGARRAAALGLALRLLFTLGLGLEAAPTHNRTSLPAPGE